MKNFSIAYILAGLIILSPVPLAAQAESVSAHDLRADEALLGPEPGGFLPPTAGQAMAGGYAASGIPGSLIAQRQHGIIRGVVTQDQQDREARVFKVNGDARIAMKDVGEWEKLKEGMIIREGHIVLTEKKAEVSVTFDDNFLNVILIPENTRAVFRSIEPTDIFLEDGTIFNLIDGLPKGSEWKITTPTAVAAVRGTYWVVNFTSATGQFLTATIDIPEDGTFSSVELIDILDSGDTGSSVIVPEGNQIDLEEGQEPDPSLLEKIDEQWINQIQNLLSDLVNDQNTNNGLPPTGGDPPGTGIGGGLPNNFLDPQLDTNSVVTDPEPIPDPVPDPIVEEPEEPCNSFNCL